MRVLRFLLVLLALTWIESGTPTAQGDSEYRALLDRYAGGDTEEPVETLSGWPEPRVQAALLALSKSLAVDKPKAVVMLHTEAAFAGNPKDAAFHLDIARRFLPRPTDDPTRAFAARWHGFVAQLYAMRDDEKRARLDISMGFAIDSKNRDAALAQGVLLERAIRRIEPNLRGVWYSSQGAVTRMLAQASQGYSVIVAEHPDFFEARLRLGWVAYLNDSPKVAHEELEAVVARALRPDVRYLAHLFLGALEEKSKRLEEATRQYEAAYAITPSQSAVVALIQVETRRGHLDQAHQIATAFADRAPTPSDDPWWPFRLGLTSGELIEWLRAEASAQ